MFETVFVKTITNMFEVINYIKYERPCLTTFPNTEKRVENTTCSGVFLTNSEVFGNVVKHCLECLIYLLNQNYN